jgi:hypothetical protein
MKIGLGQPELSNLYRDWWFPNAKEMRRVYEAITYS